MSRYAIGRIKTENEFLYGQFFCAENVSISTSREVLAKNTPHFMSRICYIAAHEQGSQLDLAAF